MAASPRKFAFDVTKPIKTGYMKKMGQGRKSFKERFFVLYKGFLVYYENDSKWKYDTSIGDTLGSRNGAIKLKGASAMFTQAHCLPKSCRYAFVLQCPDPVNTRDYYLLDSTSEGEREAWMDAIRQAVPAASPPAVENT